MLNELWGTKCLASKTGDGLKSTLYLTHHRF